MTLLSCFRHRASAMARGTTPPADRLSARTTTRADRAWDARDPPVLRTMESRNITKKSPSNVEPQGRTDVMMFMSLVVHRRAAWRALRHPVARAEGR